MTSLNFEKINDIFNCKLILEDGTDFVIPLREDGYIYATGLCKVAKKRIHDWLRLSETKRIQRELEKKNCEAGNPVSKDKQDEKVVAQERVTKSIIEINQTGNAYQQGTWVHHFLETGNPVSKKWSPIQVFKGRDTSTYKQGTWVHPDLGINLAQWCSPNFAIQISKWIRELIFCGEVQIEKEKSENDIINELRRKLKNAELRVEESEKQIQLSKNLVKAYDSNHKDMEQKYRKIFLNHQAYLRRKELYKLKTGSCVYIIDMKNTYNEEEPRYKIGQTRDINSRVSDFRTANPFLKVIYILYTDKHVNLERSMKDRYEENLLPNNSEFVTGITKESVIETLLKMAEIHNFSYTVETNEELSKFNRHIIHASDVKEENEKESNGLKRCGGLRHTTEEERLQPLSNFFKNGHHKDGYARLCKDCYLTGVYGDKRKRRKVVVLPEFNTTTHKWCNRCESVKEYNDFGRDGTSKDGYCSNCRDCKTDMKRKYKQKVKEKEQANTKKEDGKGAEETKGKEESEMDADEEESDDMDIDLITLKVE